MDQELKQRLIGAAVITALAAIFVPMLFDDPIDETGKSINELKLPEMPAKVQDVEIMPLPEKAEDIASAPAVEKPALPVAQNADTALDLSDNDAGLETNKPKIRLNAKETAPVPQSTAAIDAEMAAEAEDFAPVRQETPKLPSPKPLLVATATPNTSKPVVKPTIKPLEVVAETAAKPVTPVPAIGSETATNRWYLNAGSFSQKSNAQSLLDTLKQQGFAATIKEVASDKGPVFKVRVGPMLDKAKAQAVKAKLAQININSFVSGEE